jgi:ectoine hydroxylase-related dioxygenase (phytanoyl-CoA dioxygenase family)
MSTVAVPRAAALAEQQLRDYDRDGFVVVRGVFSGQEMAAIAAEADQLLQRTDLIHADNIRCRWQPHVETDACLFETFDPVIDLAPACAALARDERLLSLVSALYGERGYLFKDKLIWKPPGAKGCDLHQDFITWPGFPKSFVTAAVAVDPCSADNGATEVVCGCHREGYLSSADGMYHVLPDEAVAGRRTVTLELEPGDVALFGCFVPHRAMPNRSARWRRLLYLSYNAASDGGDRREEHYREFHAWLRERYAEYGKLGVYFR